jgi:hypothetical protein
MVIETKYSYLMIWLWLLGVAVAFASIVFVAVGPVVAGLLLALGGIAFIYSFYITHGRTLIFNEAGCTVRFRGEDNHIPWNDIVVKRVEPQHWGGNREYTKGCVFFSLCPTKKNPRTDPASYALLHPNTCFWVYFKSDGQGTSPNTPGIYEVDKNHFLGQLKEWGVELEHIPY